MSQVKFGSIQWEDLVQVGPVSLTADVSGVLPVANGGSGSGSFTDGQLLIGNTTGNTLAKATLTGTANQVVVTNGSGTITLSLPQSIATSSSPTFTGVTLTGNLSVQGNTTLGDASGDTVTQNAAITNTPNGLTLVTTHINSSTESLLFARLDEDTTSSWGIVNGSATDGVFAPKFQCVQSGAFVAMNFTGQGTTDTGASPVVLFVAQIGSAAVVTRPCFQFRNLSTTMLAINANSSVDFTGKITKYNAIATVSNGIPSELATIDTTGLTANVAASTLYAVPASGVGMYRISAYVVMTTAASISSTLPNVQIIYTDNDANVSVTLDATPILAAAGLGQTGALTANSVGSVASGEIVIYAKSSTTIQYSTVNYASSLAGMAYALHIKLEAM